jgi:DNA-binding Lrp family transcriptional regulator
MSIRPQDIVVALKLCLEAERPSYAELALKLRMSASEVHAAVRRLVEARLLDPQTHSVRRKALQEFLVHGVPYAFPARSGEVTRGVPTAWAAPALLDKFAITEQLAPVWPDPDGDLQGVLVRPLYPSVPRAVQNDSALHDLLALVDALRLGRARERAIAAQELEHRLSHQAQST